MKTSDRRSSTVIFVSTVKSSLAMLLLH